MSRTRTVDLALILILLIPAGAAAARTAPPDSLGLALGDTLEFTAGELRGVTWMGPDTTVVLVAEPGSPADSTSAVIATLRWQDRDGAVLREHDVTGLLSRGLAYDGKWFWSLGDPAAGQPATLYKIESDTLFVAEAYPTPGHRPRDLAWDGSQLWLVDRDRGRLDRFDPEAGEVVRSFVTPGFSPTGVASDGRNLWVSDAATGLLYRLSPGGSVWSGTVRAGDFFHRGQELALAWRQGELWLLLPGTGRAIRTRAD